MVGRLLEFGSTAKVAGETLRQRLETIKTNPQIAQYFRNSNPLEERLVQGMGLRESIERYNERVNALKTSYNTLKRYRSEDQTMSYEIVAWVSETLRVCRGPVKEENNPDLNEFYKKCVAKSGEFFSDDFFSRGYEMNKNIFVGFLYPQLFLCQGICEGKVKLIHGIPPAVFLETMGAAHKTGVADVIPIAAHFGKPFKDDVGKAIMVDGIPQDEILRKLEEAANESKRRQIGLWSRDEIVSELKKFGPDLNKELLQLLRIPEKLYHSPVNNLEFSSKEGEIISGRMFSISTVLNFPLPKKIENYSLGTFAKGSFGCFFLADPMRKLIFIDYMPDPLEHGSWKQLVRPLETAIKESNMAIEKKIKFSIVLSIHGNIKIV